MSKVIGIDISKETFDVCYEKNGKWSHDIFSNNNRGFRSFKKLLLASDHCVMEASGPYYLPLALFLHDSDCHVSVVNPLVIRRFAQMKLIRAKTDKKDAMVIAQYGITHKPGCWVPDNEHITRMRQLLTAIQSIDKQLTINTNQLHAFKSSGLEDSEVRKVLKALIKTLRLKKERLSQRLSELAMKYYCQTIQRLQSIPGIGRQTAILLTVITNNFEKFEHSRQLIAYVGLSPRIYQSGKSINGKSRICKVGKSSVRKQLYMCAWTAKFHNKTCSEMYERLKHKGKPERVIKIAIANKLLKQAFALAKNQTEFDRNYIPKPCI